MTMQATVLADGDVAPGALDHAGVARGARVAAPVVAARKGCVMVALGIAAVDLVGDGDPLCLVTSSDSKVDGTATRPGRLGQG